MLEIAGAVWFQSGDKEIGGERRIALLRAIGASGSITAAAKQVGLSYKGAWDAIDTMNNLAGAALVVRASGGRGGGGTQLTEHAIDLINTYDAVHALQQDYLLRINQAVSQKTGSLALMKHMMFKTSARNTLSGIIARIQPGAINDEVALALKDGVEIVANITHESVVALGLTEGRRAFALIKSSSVMLGVPAAPADRLAHADADRAQTSVPMRLSARNQLPGTVARISKGAVNADVNLTLANGDSLAAVITLESLEALQLSPGAPAAALFKASSVIIGVVD